MPMARCFSGVNGKRNAKKYCKEMDTDVEYAALLIIYKYITSNIISTR